MYQTSRAASAYLFSVMEKSIFFIFVHSVFLTAHSLFEILFTPLPSAIKRPEKNGWYMDHGWATRIAHGSERAHRGITPRTSRVWRPCGGDGVSSTDAILALSWKISLKPVMCTLGRFR